MLRTVAEILQGFANEETKKLDEFELKHGPTIGKMYEGLTSEILAKAIPEEIGLRIASGVIYDDSGAMQAKLIVCLLKEMGFKSLIQTASSGILKMLSVFLR